MCACALMHVSVCVRVRTHVCVCVCVCVCARKCMCRGNYKLEEMNGQKPSIALSSLNLVRRPIHSIMYMYQYVRT